MIGMCAFVGVLLFLSAQGVMPFEIVSREEWKAKPPKAVETMTTPVPYVIIHHSYIPPACTTTEECIGSMLVMQEMHQVKNGWNDIGYHFAVGGDGKAYEGRGWDRVGAHAPKYNNISIGICVIGDWTQKLPPQQQLDAAHQLITLGVEIGKIQANYKLLGHRQVRETECPGEKLFQEIKTWDHFSAFPAGYSKPSGGVANFFFLQT